MPNVIKLYDCLEEKCGDIKKKDDICKSKYKNTKKRMDRSIYKKIDSKCGELTRKRYSCSLKNCGKFASSSFKKTLKRNSKKKNLKEIDKDIKNHNETIDAIERFSNRSSKEKKQAMVALVKIFKQMAKTHKRKLKGKTNKKKTNKGKTNKKK